jgi:hypothetical protein
MKKLLLVLYLIFYINIYAQTDTVTTVVPYKSYYLKGCDAFIDNDRDRVVMRKGSFGVKRVK